MEVQHKLLTYTPQHFFNYPYTLVSLPKRSLISQPFASLSFYQVYCPISCKKIKIGACKGKDKQGLQFNTTSSRWISTIFRQNIRYLVNKHPPIKKDKKKLQGTNWSFWVQVSDKGNYAIFNPYCVVPNEPLTLYTFDKIEKIEKQLDIESKFSDEKQTGQQNFEELIINNKKYFFKTDQTGSYISTNKHFNDSPLSKITIRHPKLSNKTFFVEVDEIIYLTKNNINFWLSHLQRIILAQHRGQITEEIEFNLDIIYEKLQFYLHIDQQIRAKLMNQEGMSKLNSNYPFHPRLYSAFNRLASFVNYNTSKYDTIKLAELGFYNKSDSLQDTAFFQFPEIPISSIENPNYNNQAHLRQKLFPFSRSQRNLSNSNIPLDATINSLLHQSISIKKIIFKQIVNEYIMFVDEDNIVSIWNCSLFPVLLHRFNANLEDSKNDSKLIFQQAQLIKHLPNVQKDQSPLISLFEEPVKQVKPVQIVPDQNMVQQILQMGYGLNLIKKALVTVKNQSIPAAIDIIQQLTAEEKKKKTQKIYQWTCNTCTFFNKAESEICQMCGQLCSLDQAEKQRVKKQQQAEAERELKRLQQKARIEKQQNQELIKKENAQKEKERLQKERQQVLKSSKLIAIKLIYNEKSPIDPFFIVTIFTNVQKAKTYLKVLRLGLSRSYFNKFIKIEQQFIFSYTKRIPFSLTFESFEKIARQSKNTIQWGIRLIQPSKNTQFAISQQHQIQLAHNYLDIRLSRHTDHFTVFSNEQQKHFKISIKDDLKTATFNVEAIESAKIEEGLCQMVSINKLYKDQQVIIEQRIVQSGESIQIDSNSNEIQIEILQHLPAGIWKNSPQLNNKCIIECKNQGQVIINQFIPLSIEQFEGSVFSGKHYSSTLLQRSGNLYISNYPTTNFTFQNIAGKQMFVESIVIISSTKRLQRIYSVFQGLIFTANEPTWFQVAKDNFAKFTKNDYQNWLCKKRSRNDHRQFWQPVGFFQIDNQTETQLDFKRSARYIFLLPTSVKFKNVSDKAKDEVYAIKIDFFGAKGRIQEQKPQDQWISKFKNEGTSPCQVVINQIIDGKMQAIQPSKIFIKKVSNINNFNFLNTRNQLFQKIPISVSTYYLIKLRSNLNKISLSVNSQHSKHIKIRTKVDIVQDIVDLKSINNFKDLAKLQNQFTAVQIKKIAEGLDLKELLLLILNQSKSYNNYEVLINKIQDSLQYKQKLFNHIIQLIPILHKDDIQICEAGFKFFFALYEKLLSTQLQHAFITNNQALKKITQYISQRRNKNYNILRYKYNIEELILQPSLFSKDYYRLVYPDYIQQEVKPLAGLQQTGQINNVLFIEQITPYSYHQYIDLKQFRKISNIKFFVPKITQNAFRQKLLINIWELNNNTENLVYTRYFHEDLLVQLGINGYKDNQIYKGQRLNYLNVSNIQIEARLIKVQISLLLITSQPHSKYKELVQKYYFLPLVQSKPSNNSTNISKHLTYLQTFPQEVKHAYNLERLPPSKYASEGPKSIYNVYEFPIMELSLVKKQYIQNIDKITTNIMDETIVRESIKNMKIGNYEFNKKGIDFAYSYLILIMNLNKKFSVNMKIPVDLMIDLFNSFVVYQSGPIMKKTYAFIQQTYKRLNNLEKSIFVNAIIDKYLANLELLPSIKLSQKYSPLKIIQKLQNFELPIPNLIEKMLVCDKKSLKLILIKLIHTVASVHGIGSLQLYDVVTGKYHRQSGLVDLINGAFKSCLWILDNVQGIKQQALFDSLDLFLLFISTDLSPFTKEKRLQTVKHFLQNLQEENLWRLVFLTLKLKSEALKDKINKLFTILTANLTQNFRKSINAMVFEIIVKKPESIYVKINSNLTDQQWMNHLQITLELINMTKDNLFLDNQTALKLLQLPLTPTLWSLALKIIPRNDEILISIIKNFKKQYINSLGKQITKFCEPLAGIRSLESSHINWLDLVKKIRLENKNILQLFIQQLQLSSFGGREGLVMATVNEVKQLEITCEFAKLVLQMNDLNKQLLTQHNIKKLILWYFINKTNEKGLSPATEKIFFLSNSIKSIFQKIIQMEYVVKLCIKCLLEIHKESEVIERAFQQKLIPIHSALTLNKRFCQCFQELLTLFMHNDDNASYFSFDLGGLKHIIRNMDIDKEKYTISSISCLPDEQLLISEKIVTIKAKNEQNASQIKQLQDLKEEEFANNIKLVPEVNLAGLVPSNVDWSINKKGNKSKILFVPLTQSTHYHQHPLYIQFAKTFEVRSIKIGFQAASYEFNDKLIVAPSSVVIEGSIDGINYEPIGQMDFIKDDAYLTNGVLVWGLNCQKIIGLNNINSSIQSIGVHKTKYFKIIIKRPIVTFIEGQYSQLNGKNYNTLGCTISFLSVTGDDCEKLSFSLIQSCKQISKRSALNMLSLLLNQNNSSTMKKVANNQQFSNHIKQHFQKISQYIIKYQDVMPSIVYLIGAGNKELGNWIVNYFLKNGGGQIQAKIINQIIISTPQNIFSRISLFLRSILEKIEQINQQTQIQSGILYTKEIHFMQYFCRTLQQSYELQTNKGILEVNKKDIDNIISIYDKKHSSPDIKSLLKLLINLLHVKYPFQLSNLLTEQAMNIIWENCSEIKAHFYNLMASLLIDRKVGEWLKINDYSKVKVLIESIYKSIKHKQYKNLKLQIVLLSQISYHSSEFLRKEDVHIELYQRLKCSNITDQQISESILKILRNIVLNNQKEEKRLATILYQDVGLVVKKTDPFLQKLFVGILGLQSQVMLHISGIDLQTASKKQSSINSKYLTKKNQKIITDLIGKKYKFSLFGQITGQLKVDNQEIFLKAFSGASVLLLLRFQIHQAIHTVAVYSPQPSKRNQQGDYYWQEIIKYNKTGFICFLQQKEPFIIKNIQQEAMLGNIYGGDQEQQNAVVFYDNSQEVIQFSFTTNEITVPKFMLKNYKKELPSQLTNNNIDSDCEGYNFIGLQLWQLKVLNSVQVSDSKISNLLSKSNQARPPFSYYRHNPIYIFPANITLNKFTSMIGLKGSCTSKGKKIRENMSLNQLQADTSDFVIDLQIQSQEQNKDEFSEYSQNGYIPKINIFNHFFTLKGIQQFFKLGSESLAYWKKADRKKNFQHYLQELKSFINLPNFFNLFVKNQQYVTLLFQVASGLPDDDSNTRNWEQQYVNNFRFIYKIVSDIFKYDRSPELRSMDNYADFIDVILQKLSEITKEAPRTIKEEQQEISAVQVQNLQIKKVKSQDRKRKKKGTGYGADNQNNSKWSASQWLEARKNISQQTLRVVSIIASFLDCQISLVDERLSDIIKQSCMLPILQSALRSGSLLDISKQSQLFKSYLQIVRLLSSHQSTIRCLLQLEKKYKPQQSESIYSLLGKLNGIALIFTQCLKSGKEQSNTNQVAQSISLDIQRTYNLVEKAVKNLKTDKKVITAKQLNNMPIADAYRLLLSKLRFDYVNLKEGNNYKHAHSSSISTNSPPTSKILRLSQQLADLSSSLPCEHTNSIFVRCDKSRIDVINVLIMGSKDTPYANGAFTFDVYCDDSYPNNPPKMLITTTGQGKIRFNPNLYSCGKVCLSLLGTWRGSASQNWDPKVSTLLQLFISTQGITMSQDIYFNQPGFQGQQGTDEGEKKNQAYSNIVRLGNVKYAMVGHLKNPPKGFEDVIKRHFYIKRKQILQECQKWIELAQKREASYNGLVNDHNSNWCTQLKQSKTKYKELLIKEVQELRTILNTLQPPNLEQKQEVQQQLMFHKNTTKREKKQIINQEIKLEEVDVSYNKQENQIKEYEANVMQDRWSRYIGAMGLQAVKKQSQSSVLLIGIKYLGLEIAKNLVLSGLKRLTIFQKDQLQNKSEHFYMSNLASNDLKDCIFKIKQLNPYMLVQYTDKLPPIESYSVVVSTANYTVSKEISEQCRKFGTKFIWASTKGVSGTYFADLGLHQINDNNGQELFEGIIKSISNQEQGLVTLMDGIRHPYQDGDYVVLTRVQGMEQQKETIQQKSQAQIFYQKQSNEKIKGINNRVYKIKVINWNSFRIGDTRNFSQYKINGLCKNIKIPYKIQYKALTQCEKQFNKYLDQSLGVYDFEKIADNQRIFLCFRALSQFEIQNKKLPSNWSIKDSEQFIKILKHLINDLNLPEQQKTILLNYGKNFAHVSQSQLPIIAAYLGGIVSQQIIKAITNKYMPIRQFFTFHFNQMLQKVPQTEEQIEKLHVKQDQKFQNLKIVIGREGSTKVEQLKTFVIGAGAIGCQILKNFAMINLGAQGQIVVTDPDHIETSNLSRQFLFRQKHVKKAKSATACASLIQINPDLKGHIFAKLDKICQETQQIYSNQFIRSRSLIANALDNVKARQYVDKRCVQNKVALFQSGTLGPKGHVQVIVPYKTQNYGSQNDPNEEAQIPHCTLKMFPEETVHCIQWARDIFGKIFTLNPKALKKVLQTKSLKSLEGKQRETVIKIIKYRPQSFDDCIAEAVRKFYSYFRNNVRQLMFTYPLDMKNKDGKPFWQLPKRPPKQIHQLDEKEDSHSTFISAYSVLLAKIFKIPYPKDFRKIEGKAKIMQIARKIKVQDFVPSQQTSKQIEKQVQQEKTGEIIQNQPPVGSIAQNNSETQQIQLTQEILELKITPEEFEKDQDQNGHIDLIYAMSNLRCINYGINECTWIQAKLKAGKILAALSTTTSVVSALQTIQIIKLAINSTVWRNAFINLAVSMIQISQPGPPTKHSLGNTQFTVWDDWKFKVSTIKQLLNAIKQKYEIQPFNISTNEGKPVYWQVMYADKQESREALLNTPLKNMFEQTQIVLNMSMRNPTNGQIYANVPKINVQIV